MHVRPFQTLTGTLPGAMLFAGEMGPEPDRDCWDWVEPAGETTGEGEGPLLWLGRWGEAWGEKGDCPWLPVPPCSPWLLLLLEDPAALTAGPRPASVPVGRSSIEPDRSWNRRGALQWVFMRIIQAFDESWQAAGGKFKCKLKQAHNFPRAHYVIMKLQNCKCYWKMWNKFMTLSWTSNIE